MSLSSIYINYWRELIILILKGGFMKFGVYCGIIANKFSEKFKKPYMTSETEIVDFLLSDAECTFYKQKLIPGDLNIWYLGTCKGAGFIQVGSNKWDWIFGESSWTNVKKMIISLGSLGMTPKNINRLNSVYNEGVLNFSFSYDIRHYLNAKKSGLSWSHPGNNSRKDALSYHTQNL